MTKKRYTDEQVLDEAQYLVLYGRSTYQMAAHFGIPQSTAWWHMSVRLKTIDPELQEIVQNEMWRHYTGGGR